MLRAQLVDYDQRIETMLKTALRNSSCVRFSISGLLASIILLSAACAPYNPALPVPEISAGDDHACSVEELSGVFCWGDNTYGQTDGPLYYPQY